LLVLNITLNLIKPHCTHEKIAVTTRTSTRSCSNAINVTTVVNHCNICDCPSHALFSLGSVNSYVTVLT